MTDLRKAASMALDAMLSEYSTGGENKYSPWDVIEALRQALAQPDWTTDTPVPPFKYFDSPEYKIAQPEQDPVCDKDPYYCGYVRCQLGKVCKNTAPPKREWVGLTDEDEQQCRIEAGAKYVRHKNSIRGQMISPADEYEWHLIRAIEAKLKEKNT